MKYKVGDRVKLKDCLKNLDWLDEEISKEYEGGVFKISKVDETYDYPYSLEGVKHDILFCDEDIEGLEDELEIRELEKSMNIQLFEKRERVIQQLESLKLYCEDLSDTEDPEDSFLKDVAALNYALRIIKKEPVAPQQNRPLEK